jgi:hypothetical protein
MDSLWKIPSLEIFLNKLVQHLWGGQIVIVFIPDSIPERFYQELKFRCKKAEIDTFHSIDFNNTEHIWPEEAIYDYFELSDSEHCVNNNVREIFDSINIDINHLLMLKIITCVNKEIFMSFIDELLHYCRSKEHKKRLKILVIIENNSLTPDEFLPEPNLEKMIFSQQVDALAQLNGLRYVLQMTGQMEELTEKIITSLAVFDYGLTEQLANSRSLLDEFEDVLTNYANERSWQQINFIEERYLTNSDKWYRWSKGILDYNSNGGVIYHSAYLHIHGKDDLIKRRLWETYLGVLLPDIERVRNMLIVAERIEFTDNAFLVDGKRSLKSKYDFEIGGLARGFNERSIIVKGASEINRKQIIQYVNLCRNIRNDLSHLNIPKVEDLRRFYDEKVWVEKMLVGGY